MGCCARRGGIEIDIGARRFTGLLGEIEIYLGARRFAGLLAFEMVNHIGLPLVQTSVCCFFLYKKRQ